MPEWGDKMPPKNLFQCQRLSFERSIQLLQTCADNRLERELFLKWIDRVSYRELFPISK